MSVLYKRQQQNNEKNYSQLIYNIIYCIVLHLIVIFIFNLKDEYTV